MQGTAGKNRTSWVTMLSLSETKPAIKLLLLYILGKTATISLKYVKKILNHYHYIKNKTNNNDNNERLKLQQEKHWEYAFHYAFWSLLHENCCWISNRTQILNNNHTGTQHGTEHYLPCTIWLYNLLPNQKQIPIQPVVASATNQFVKTTSQHMPLTTLIYSQSWPNFKQM